ncbi:hypothetical protein ACFKHW_07155 [Bradyrhizobium lupini]|uniref:hypothetical protein n=1 Tax=Rhizobium lupini TaxID=136996 RepID=UPI00366E888B
MSRNNIRASACSQQDAAQIPAEFQQPPALDELRVRKLVQRFALAPELARAVADLAFAAEARA